jgi:probable phosphoglycerate mutase
MTELSTRYLYLVRHAEALPDESGLSENGRRQATLLGQRLRDRPIAVAYHGPLPRATQTARLIVEQLHGVALKGAEAAGDYVPYRPERNELPPDCAGYLLRFLDLFTAEEHARGSALARQALEQFTGPVVGGEERHELVVTHNFLVSWLVRHAMDAPKWRWLGLNQCHAALTVIRYAPSQLPSVLVYNDMRHLPAELSWTGFPPELRL